jgi:hypothetical protein
MDDLYLWFPCPFCQGRLRKGDVIGGDYVRWLPTGVGFWKTNVFGSEGMPESGGRCDQCGVIILGKAEALPSPPPPWTVRISDRQEAIVQMQVIQELLLRHRIPGHVAYQAASQFRRGAAVVVLVKDAEAGGSLVSALKGLGLEAELVAP